MLKSKRDSSLRSEWQDKVLFRILWNVELANSGKIPAGVFGL
jgi:hypothetical protein